MMSAFKLPLRLSKVARYVEDSEGRSIILCDSRAQAAEIVEAVNSQELLEEAEGALEKATEYIRLNRHPKSKKAPVVVEIESALARIRAAKGKS